MRGGEGGRGDRHGAAGEDGADAGLGAEGLWGTMGQDGGQWPGGRSRDGVGGGIMSGEIAHGPRRRSESQPVAFRVAPTAPRRRLPSRMIPPEPLHSPAPQARLSGSGSRSDGGAARRRFRRDEGSARPEGTPDVHPRVQKPELSSTFRSTETDGSGKNKLVQYAVTIGANAPVGQGSGLRRGQGGVPTSQG